jgi:peptide/nickel transport system substrate-binding protein
MTMDIERRSVLVGTVTAMGLASMPGLAFAQSRAETLRYVTGNTINTLDCTVLGATRESFGLAMNIHDRLFKFGRKPVGDHFTFDPTEILPELAAGYETSADGLKITIRLRPDAVWHDGSKVTAEDIKWSLDRCVTAKSLGPSQFQLGSMTSADQFKITGDHTIELTLPAPDKLALANLCVPYAQMFNSKLVKPHLTADDPWGLEWTKLNTAGSGAYIVESFKPNESIILRRDDTWKYGKLPYFRRIIIQTVPEPATRANLVEKRDADLCIDLAASDISTVAKDGKAKVVSMPQTNGFTMLAMNTQMAPFDKVKVRQAIAAALPYEDMFKAALFSRGYPLFGADWTRAPNGSFPQKMPFKTDLPKARRLLTEAGFPDGFKTSFAFSTGQAATAEPMAALLKEGLGKIGIEVDIQKKSDAEFQTMEVDKKLAFFTDQPTAWLPFTDYFFRLYFTRDQRWNFSGWDNKEMEDISIKARFDLDPAKVEQEDKQMIDLYFANVPLITIWQPNHDAAMAKNIEGYTYEFYRLVDFRELARV